MCALHIPYTFSIETRVVFKAMVVAVRLEVDTAMEEECRDFEEVLLSAFRAAVAQNMTWEYRAPGVKIFVFQKLSHLIAVSKAMLRYVFLSFAC